MHNNLSTYKKEIKNNKTIYYKIKFIDCLRFMSSSLSSLNHNPAEALYKNDCISYLEHTRVQYGSAKAKEKCLTKIYQNNLQAHPDFV